MAFIHIFDIRMVLRKQTVGLLLKEPISTRKTGKGGRYQDSHTFGLAKSKEQNSLCDGLFKHSCKRLRLVIAVNIGLNMDDNLNLNLDP